MSLHLHVIYGCFQMTIAELSSCNTDHLANQAKIFTIWTFIENINLWLKQIGVYCFSMASLEQAVQAWCNSPMMLIRPRLFLSFWSTSLSISTCFIMISKQLPVLQKLHMISTFETERHVKGISVPSTRKVDYTATPGTFFPVSSPRSLSYGPTSFKGSWESHGKHRQD